MEWYQEWEGGVYYTDYELVVEGMLEHFSIATRYKGKFPTLFPNYSVYNYSLQATTKTRTIQSALSFMDGLLHGTGPLESSPDRLDIVMKGYMPPGMVIEKNDEDRLLRFMDCCPKYEKYIKTLKWKDESNLFDELPLYQSVVQSVSSALKYDATLNDSKALYYLCAAENMSPTQAGHSQFCSVFDEESLDVLDYSKDLEKYHKYSYPYPTTYKMSCLLLSDIIKEMEGNKNTPVLKFAHEETVMPLLSLLGLFDDGEIMTHKMVDWKNRKMKVSRVTPFAGNVAFVRQSCPGDDEPRIQVIVNEKEVKVPLCSRAGCTVADLKEIISTRADGCNYNLICNISPDKWDDKHSTQQIIIAVLLTLSLCQATYIFFHCIKRCPLNSREDQTDCSDQQPLIEEESDQGYADEPDSNLVTTVLDD
ncbi:multiple inositol polyphosphate phosphatase 1-like [Bolinopsis microptera]|uniref:multiple inositol polyphosphate phosphatase 1-like n=1 Tax=Bolinopsis microptera TaxID=2820187 RepID=UPI00307A14E3